MSEHKIQQENLSPAPAEQQHGQTERSQELGSNPKTQFTQGPWRVISGEFIADDDGNTVANVIAYAIEFPAPACINSSDARLIAAGPEMYEALRALYLEVSSQWYPLTIAEQVEAALAKAEGRSL